MELKWCPRIPGRPQKGAKRWPRELEGEPKGGAMKHIKMKNWEKVVWPDWLGKINGSRWQAAPKGQTNRNRNSIISNNIEFHFPSFYQNIEFRFRSVCPFGGCFPLKTLYFSPPNYFFHFSCLCVSLPPHRAPILVPLASAWFPFGIPWAPSWCL